MTSGVLRAEAVPTATVASDTSRIDLRIARALLVMALAVVAIYGSDVARHVPVYGPIDEFFHVAYVQKIVDSGHPPKVGTGLILGLGQKAPTPRDVVIRGLDHPFDPTVGHRVTPVFPDGTTFPNNEAIQAPLYYYALAPIALVVPWSQRILVMRLAGTFFVMLALVLLYAAVREVSPHRPLAAGLAAAILGTMTGLTSLLSQVQNDALLLPVCVATFWLLARDLRRRRSSLLLPFVAALTVLTHLVAGPAAVVAVLAGVRADGRLDSVSWRSREVLRLLVSRLGVFALTLGPWVMFNLYEYRWLWPIGGSEGGGGAPAARNLGLLRHFVELMHGAALGIFGSLWLQLWPPGGGVDARPPVVIAAAGAIALVVALHSGELLRERRRLGFWAGVAIVSFLSVFSVLLANATSVGGAPDFVGRYFAAFAAAYAAFVATAVASMLRGHPWILRGCACGMSLLLAWQMLDLAYPRFAG